MAYLASYENKTRPPLPCNKAPQQILKAAYKDYEATIYGLRYLKRYDDSGIILGKIADLRFMAYPDASHTGWHDRKSTEGSV
jgi:hypothetical protein